MVDADSSDEDNFDDDEYDDFFFESIQKYNTLQMFILENVPYQLFQLDSTTLCIASKLNRKEQTEMLKLLLPPKLTLPPQEKGRSKENDFKVLCGLYTKNLVQKAVKLTDKKVITSENNTAGLMIYTFTDGTLGTQNQGTALSEISWISPDFTVSKESNSVISCKCIHNPLVQVDLNEGKLVKTIKHPFQEQNVSHDGLSEHSFCSGKVKCEVLNENQIVILNSETGDSVLHDLRAGDFIHVPKLAEKHVDEIWTLSSYDFNPSMINNFGILSNKKSFCIYDKRTNNILVQNAGFCPPKTNVDNLRLKFCERGDKFSISGLDSSVEIFKLKASEFEHVFTHIGHSGQGSFPSKYVITDHIWLLAGGKEYIASICDNKTLNCWDYKV